jgi:membrane-associated protein
MEHILQLIQEHFPALLEHKYLFLFIAASLEGLNTMILAGFLVSIGGLALIPAALICFAGEMINSYFWYTLGYMAGAKPIDWLTRNSPSKRKLVERIRSYLERHTGKILLMSKITFSLTIATLILTGSMKYNLKKFSWYNLIGSIGWIIITFSIGYFFGQGYKYYLDYFESLSYLIIFLIVAAIVVYAAEGISSAIFTRTIFINDRLQELNEKIKEGLSKLIDDGDEAQK